MTNLLYEIHHTIIVVELIYSGKVLQLELSGLRNYMYLELKSQQMALCISI